jgi:hypothetical protein
MVPQRSGRLTLLGLGMGLMLGLMPAAARAGATVAESIISREDAISDAKQLMPSGAIVSQVDCIEIALESVRYRCIVQWIPGSRR